MRTPFTLFFAAACLAGLSMPASACRVDAFNFVWGADSGTHVAARSSESCKFGFRANPRGHVRSAVVVQPPAHGSVSEVDQTHCSYKPARGYQGHDTVVVKADGEIVTNRGSHSGETNLTYDFDISP